MTKPKKRTRNFSDFVNFFNFKNIFSKFLNTKFNNNFHRFVSKNEV